MSGSPPPPPASQDATIWVALPRRQDPDRYLPVWSLGHDRAAVAQCPAVATADGLGVVLGHGPDCRELADHVPWLARACWEASIQLDRLAEAPVWAIVPADARPHPDGSAYVPDPAWTTGYGDTPAIAERAARWLGALLVGPPEAGAAVPREFVVRQLAAENDDVRRSAFRELLRRGLA